MTISIIIPTLNEAGYIEQTLHAVRAQAGLKEIIVVDGGSTDETVARADPLARILQTEPGRAAQMNRGAEAASGEAFFFLHADTRPPPYGLTAIRDALSAPTIEAGIFRLSFDRSTPWLQFYAWCTRWPWIRIAFGDRGLFVKREAFEAVGGFPDWPIFEDLELANRLYRRGGFRFIPQSVTTSARRFDKHGALRQQLRNTYLWLHYQLGTDPERVAHLYTYDTRPEA